MEARIDTGGELLTLSPDVAERLGVEPVARAEGVFAAGARGKIDYGRLDSVRVGPLTVRAVPVAIMALERPVIGTGLLRQFLATVDYPGKRFLLRPRSSLPPRNGVEIPFVLAASLSSSPPARSATTSGCRSSSTPASRTKAARPWRFRGPPSTFSGSRLPP